MTPTRPRVIQWGTGAVGAEMLTAILDHRPDLDLVGAKVYSKTKHGKDVATLVGRDPVGVLATADTAGSSRCRRTAVSLTSAHKDTSSYQPRTTDLDEVCTILASGKNVATTASLPLVRSLIGFGNA